MPKEYSDWDVTLYDWQSQCSMQPQSSGIKCLLKRILPTVGCEADAQTFNEEKRQLFETSNGSTQHAILDNGSYTTASAQDLNGQTSLRAEHCLVTAEKKRIRLVQHLKAAEPSGSWQLQSVEMHHEYHDGPYNGGASLSGCGGGMSNFAESPRLEEAQLEQDWIVQSGISYNVSEDCTQDMPSRCA